MQTRLPDDLQEDYDCREAIGIALEAYIAKRDLSGEALGRQWGLAPSYVRRMIRGNLEMSLARAVQVCVWIGETPGSVLLGERPTPDVVAALGQTVRARGAGLAIVLRATLGPVLSRQVRRDVGGPTHVAGLLDCARVYVHRLENGEILPTTARMVRLARLCDRPLDSMLIEALSDG